MKVKIQHPKQCAHSVLLKFVVLQNPQNLTISFRVINWDLIKVTNAGEALLSDMSQMDRPSIPDGLWKIKNKILKTNVQDIFTDDIVSNEERIYIWYRLKSFFQFGSFSLEKTIENSIQRPGVSIGCYADDIFLDMLLYENCWISI